MKYKKTFQIMEVIECVFLMHSFMNIMNLRHNYNACLNNMKRTNANICTYTMYINACTHTKCANKGTCAICIVQVLF